MISTSPTSTSPTATPSVDPILRGIIDHAIRSANGDDEAALEAMGAALTAVAGGKVAALGTGSSKGRPALATVMCASQATLVAVSEILTKSGLALLDVIVLPADEIEVDFPDGQYMGWFNRDYRAIRKAA